MTDATFRTVLRGYEPTEVDQYVRSLHEAAEAARQAVAERTVELERERGQRAQSAQDVERLKARLATLEEEARNNTAPTFADLGERIGKILTLAQEEADQARTSAQADADVLVREAQEKADRQTAQARAHADESISRTDAEVARRLADAQRRADEILDVADREAAARREEAEAVFERQRAKAAAAATEFETTLAERRDQAAAEFARSLAKHDQTLAAAEERLATVDKDAERLKADSEREAAQLLTSARAEAEQVLREARETAEKIRRESDRELAAASSQREAITAQLSNVRQMLATIGGGVSGAALGALLPPEAPAEAKPAAAADQAEAPADSDEVRN